MRALRVHLLGASILLLSPLLGCKTGYLVRSAWYQAELLNSRVPLDEARTSMRLSDAQLQSLDLVGDAKA
ncbi:MAG: hypothetical protein QGG40_16595, partial [Myxococcota bacterium]|nr:hypothetical protein [Myxococcota bacterium]